MKSALIIALTCLLVLSVQGQLTPRMDRCKCLNGVITVRNLRLIKADVKIHQPSAFCPNTEIIVVTIADNQSKCLDPASLLGRVLLKTRRVLE